MTATNTARAITRARKDSLITEKEARSIIKATKTSLSNIEAKKITDLFHSNVLRRNDSIRGPVLPPMASPAMPRFEAGAVRAFTELFVKRNMPIGDHADVMRIPLTSFAVRADLGTGTSTPPRSEAKLMELFLFDHTAVNGTREDALVDVAKQKFYLKRVDPTAFTPTYFGPFDLPKIDPGVQRLASKLQREIEAGRPFWTDHSILPTGRLTRLELMSEGRNDGATYTALVEGDPLTAKRYFVERRDPTGTTYGEVIVNPRDV